MDKFYSDNIIFFDTEFTHMDTCQGELLSIGLVKSSGEELYLELEYQGLKIHPWVKEKVLPYLTGEQVSREVAQEKLWEFIGKDKKKPYLMAYVNQFDSIYWYKLFGDPKEHPAFWIPIDFATILFAHGYNPESMRKDKFFEEIGVDVLKYQHHNALDDARKLKEVYERFLQRVNNS